MTERVERLVSSDELMVMVVKCRPCGAEITIDFQKAEQRDRLVKDRYCLKCPICDADFDSALSDSLRTFHTWHGKLSTANATVVFRISS